MGKAVFVTAHGGPEVLELRYKLLRVKVIMQPCVYVLARCVKYYQSAVQRLVK